MLLIPVVGLVVWYNLPAWRGRYKVWLANSAIRGQLDRVVPMVYPDGAPLDTIFARIREATKGEEFPRGFPVHINPEGLQSADKDLAAVAKINAPDRPLKESLKAILLPMGLDYYIKDGLLIVDDKDSIDP